MFTDPHIGFNQTVNLGLRLRALDDYGPDPVQSDRFHSDHPNDQGERTNKKLKVQPFYHRGRNGKMRKF
ncbi:hypothetical protein D3C78_823830 [compost metagenome]